MSWFGELARRIVMLFHTEQFDADLKEEMRLHNELREQELIEAGDAPEEARYAARRSFGNDIVLREESRDMWRWNWWEHMSQDVRYGLRIRHESQFYRRGSANAGSGHRGKHRHLQCGECGPAETLALSRS